MEKEEARDPASSLQLTVAQVVRLRLVEQLEVAYPGCGYFYVIGHPSFWGKQTFKVGKTTDLQKRLYSYNCHQPANVVVHLVLFCTDMSAVEEHVKAQIGRYLVDDTRLEWIHIRFSELHNLIFRLVEQDRAASEQCGFPVHRLVPHDCPSSCLPNVTETDGYSKAHVQMLNTFRRSWNVTVPCVAQQQQAVHDGATDSAPRDCDGDHDEGTLCFVRYESPSQSSADAVDQRPQEQQRVAQTRARLDLVDSPATKSKATTTKQSWGDEPVVSSMEVQQLPWMVPSHLPTAAANVPSAVSSSSGGTGLSGIYFDPRGTRWIADSGRKGPGSRKSFSENKWGGRDSAKRLAIDWRREQQQQQQQQPSCIHTCAPTPTMIPPVEATSAPQTPDVTRGPGISV